MFETGSFFALGALAEVGVQLALAAVILLRSRGSPQVRLTWLILVLVVPVVGVIFYLLLGEIRLGRKKIERHRKVCDQIEAQAAMSVATIDPSSEELGRAIHIARLAETVSGTGTRPGNLLRLYSETDHAIDGLVEDTEAAKSSCNLLFYIWLPDSNGTRVGEALMRAAKRGVTCRVLVDSHGSKLFLKSEICQRMRGAGVRVTEAMPVGFLRSGLQRIDIRNHRKIAIFDGNVAWMGSQNIADAAFAIKAKYAPWVDLMIRLQGPAVHDLQVLFTEDWLLDVEEPAGEPGEGPRAEPAEESVDDVLTEPPAPLEGGVPVQVIGTGPFAQNRALVALTQVGLLQARQEIVLTTPYFVPDETTLAALCSAAQSGVSTLLVVPARNDSPLVAAASRSYYELLLEAGVVIYEYRPGLLHAKTITVDCATSVVATSNMDRRSFELNFEVSVMAFDREFSSKLRAVQQSYIDESARVDLAQWRQRRWPERLRENAAGILAPVL